MNEIDDSKLKRLEELFKLVDGSISKEEFVEAFRAVMEVVKEATDDLREENSDELKSVRTTLATLSGNLDSLSAKVVEDSAETLKELKQQVALTLGSQIELISNRLKEIKNGETPSDEKLLTLIKPLIPKVEPGKDGSPDTGDDIIKKINKADLLIEKSAIAGIEELEKKVEEKTGNTVRVGWGAHPLQVQGLGIVIDKNTRVLNFKGPSLTSVTRLPNGVVEVVIGGGGTGYVGEEVPTNTGDDLTFTLAHTPIAGTLRVYRGGARQASIGVTPDYSISGTTLTLSVALNSAAGELLFVDYQYA